MRDHGRSSVREIIRINVTNCFAIGGEEMIGPCDELIVLLWIEGNVWWWYRRTSVCKVASLHWWDNLWKAHKLYNMPNIDKLTDGTKWSYMFIMQSPIVMQSSTKTVSVMANNHNIQSKHIQSRIWIHRDTKPRDDLNSHLQIHDKPPAQ